MKGKFDAYVLRPLAKRVQNGIVDLSTSCDFRVVKSVIYPQSLRMKTLNFDIALEGLLLGMNQTHF